MMNNFGNSSSQSIPRDLSHGSSEGDQVPNNNISTFNMGNSSPYEAAGGSANVPFTAKPRGRPRGSKNRPKEESNEGSKEENESVKPMVEPMVLNVPDGVNIIDWLTNFAKSNKLCITVIGGFGKVSETVLWNRPSQNPPLLYKEHLNLINLGGSCLYSSSLENVSSIFLNASLVRVTGGIICGEALRMITMGEVVLSAKVFSNPDIFIVQG